MNKGSDDLPIEYLTSSLAQQNQVSFVFIYYVRLSFGAMEVFVLLPGFANYYQVPYHLFSLKVHCYE